MIITCHCTACCIAPRCTGMWGALATNPPSGPNKAQEKSSLSYRLEHWVVTIHTYTHIDYMACTSMQVWYISTHCTTTYQTPYTYIKIHLYLTNKQQSQYSTKKTCAFNLHSPHTPVIRALHLCKIVIQCTVHVHLLAHLVYCNTTVVMKGTKLQNPRRNTHTEQM